MKTQPTILLLTAISLFAAAAATANTESLKVHLPREITIEGTTPTLGQVAILRGSETLASLAGDIALGRLATPDQNIVVSKHMILSRLATNGIAASRVTFTGAEETVVTRQHERISDDQFVKEATAFLKNNLPDPSICRIEVIRTPGEMVLAGSGENIRLICRLLNAGARNQCKVLVAAFDGDKEVGRKEVYFRFRYQARRVVTRTALNKGDLISTANITIETAVSDFPEPVGWIAPYGLIATRPVPANTVLTDAMVSTPQPQVVIKRNQNVAIKIENAGLVATAFGKALQDGVSGEYIKVQNIDSKVIIMARVSDDGTVEPVF
jgi:flagella basal body P-ring formation protein FlgA